MKTNQTSHIRFSVSVKTSSGRWRELEKLRFFLFRSHTLSLFSHNIRPAKNFDSGDLIWIKCYPANKILQHLAQLLSVFLTH